MTSHLLYCFLLCFILSCRAQSNPILNFGNCETPCGGVLSQVEICNNTLVSSAANVFEEGCLCQLSSWDPSAQACYSCAVDVNSLYSFATVLNKYTAICTAGATSVTSSSTKQTSTANTTTSAPTTTAQNHTSSSGLSGGGLIAVAVVIPVVCVILLAVLGYWYRRHRKRNQMDSLREEYADYIFHPNGHNEALPKKISKDESEAVAIAYRGWRPNNEQHPAS